MTNYMIEVNDLTKIYPKSMWSAILGKEDGTRALDDVSFKVRKGEIFGYLGPNGAGKTTTIRILGTTLIPTSGNVEVLGYDVLKNSREIRKRMNIVMGGEINLPQRLKVREFLEYYSYLYYLSPEKEYDRINNILNFIDLTDKENEKVSMLSRGMIQKLMIGRALLNDPELLLLDEPTASLDVKSAMKVRNLFKNLSSKGKTLFLTTHNMWEAELLCDNIVLLNNGKVEFQGKIDNLKNKVKIGKKLKVKFSSEPLSFDLN
ncbi:MAG: ABC transporter ATP-binding protein [Methanosarcinales archaeon]